MRAFAGVYVDRVDSAGDAVLVAVGVDILVGRYRMYAAYSSRFAHAGLRRGGGDVAVGEFGEVLFEDAREGEDVLPKLTLRGAEITVVRGIGRPACDVHGHAAFVHDIVEPRAAEIGQIGPGRLHGQQFFAYGFALARSVDAVVVHAPVQQFALGVDSRKDETVRGGLQLSVRIRLHRHVGHVCQIAVAGTVDEDFGGEGFEAVFVFDNHRFDPLPLHFAADHRRVHVHVHAGFPDHPLTAEFVEFDVEIDVRLGPFDESAAHRLQSLDELPGDSSDDQFVFECEYADRRDVSDRGHPAEEAVSLDDRCLRALPCRRDRRDESRRAAACDHDVVPARERGELPDFPAAGVRFVA